MVNIAANLAHVQERIHAAARRVNRDPAQITLVAVTKTVPLETILAAYALGLRHFGENRVQEAAEKMGRWGDGEMGRCGERELRVAASPRPPVTASPVWHLIGHLQTNKVKVAVSIFQMVQSVDSLMLARALNAHCQRANRRLPILLQLNVTGEPSKTGFRPDGVFWETVPRILALPNLEVQGLMTIAPLVTNPEAARPAFRLLRAMRDELRHRYPSLPWPHLSMGMSDDFEIAIEEGATIIRLGRALFGERK